MKKSLKTKMERFCGNIDIFSEIRYDLLYRVKALKRPSYKGF